jgi:hypothetical protein
MRQDIEQPLHVLLSYAPRERRASTRESRLCCQLDPTVRCGLASLARRG